MTTRFLRSLLLLAAVVPGAPPAIASGYLWSPPTGIPVCGDACRTNYHLVTEDGAGGLFVTWTDYRDLSNPEDNAYLQRITASGEIAPGWPADGLSLCSLPRSQSPQAIAGDGEGGVIVAWYDDRSVGPTFGTGSDVYVQRVRRDGTLTPGWPENGVPATLALYGQVPHAIAPDGAGGAYVVWQDERDYPTQFYDIYAQHLTATGSVAEGWPVDGLSVCTAPDFQTPVGALPDGAGGVVFVWEDCRAGNCFSDTPSADIYGLRLLPDGTIAPGWAMNGSVLVALLGAPRIAVDGAGGFYVACSTAGEINFAEHWVHRFTFSGARAEGWPAEGIRVCGAPLERHPPTVAADGFGGLLLAWSDQRGLGPSVIFASRVLPNGSLAPGWTSDGVPIGQVLGGQSYNPELVADGTGGAYVCWEWEDYSGGGTDGQIQHLTAEGAVAPGWPAGGVLVATSLGQYFPRVVSDAVGGAIVAWEEHGVPPRAGVFAQRFSPDGPTPVALALASANATPERVWLRWAGPGAGSVSASVYRRDPAGDWEHLGAAIRDGPDLLRYEDRAITAGTRYAYRLGYWDEGSELFTEAAWVEVPLALRLALEGFQPNPAVGSPVISFTLEHERARDPRAARRRGTSRAQPPAARDASGPAPPAARRGRGARAGRVPDAPPAEGSHCARPRRDYPLRRRRSHPSRPRAVRNPDGQTERWQD